MRATGKFFLIGTVFSGAAILGGPFLTVYAISNAVQKKDSEKLASHVAFGQLRQNLKTQFRQSLQNNAQINTANNPFGDIAMVFASTLIEGAVETFVTPEGLEKIVLGKVPTLNAINSATSDAGDKMVTEGARKKQEYRYKYQSLNRFSVWLVNQNKQETQFVLTRKGLSWKLTNIIFPVPNTHS